MTLDVFYSNKWFFPMGRIRQWCVNIENLPRHWCQQFSIEKTEFLTKILQDTYQTYVQPPNISFKCSREGSWFDFRGFCQLITKCLSNCVIFMENKSTEKDSSSVKPASPITIVNEREKSIFDASTHFFSVSFCHWSVWHLIVFSRCVPRRGNEV